MKYIALEELQKHIIHDGCDEGCGYIDERDLAAIPTIDLDEIRAEIMDFEEELFHRPNTDYADYATVRHCVEIIDKYMAERSGE